VTLRLQKKFSFPLSARLLTLALCILGQIPQTAAGQEAPSKNIRVQSAFSEPLGEAAANPVPHSHSVTLSWKASQPASQAAGDVVIGYIVYRSTKAHDPNTVPLNSTHISGTTYVDDKVQAGKTYYYVTRAMSKSGKLSSPSNEARVEIPR